MNRGPIGPPYGPPGNLKRIFAAWRERGLPDRISKEWLERIGLSGNLATRNLHALRYLRLIDDGARPSEIAQRLRIASAEAYPAILGAVVRTAYAEVWATRDPANDDRERLADAFRHLSPAAQRSRMVAFFLGLCAQAHLPLKDPPPSRDGVRVAARQSPARRGAVEAPVAGAEPDRFSPQALLFAKFPDFDPTWSDGVKEKWFEGFARLHDDVAKRSAT